GEVVRRRVERLGVAAHHVAVLDAREDVHLHVLHARGHAAVRLEHRGGRGVVLVAPDDAHRGAHAFELADEVEELRAVTGDARVVAQAFRPEDRIGAAVAEADHRGAAVEERLAAQQGERVGEVALPGADFFEARLAARRGEHDRRHLRACLGRHEVAIELRTFARADLDIFLQHGASPGRESLARESCGRTILVTRARYASPPWTYRHALARQASWRLPWLFSLTSSPAPLPLAWDSVVVPIHLHTGTVPQEERRFVAGGHLGAIGPAVALELNRRQRTALRNRLG